MTTTPRCSSAAADQTTTTYGGTVALADGGWGGTFQMTDAAGNAVTGSFACADQPLADDDDRARHRRWRSRPRHPGPDDPHQHLIWRVSVRMVVAGATTIRTETGDQRVDVSQLGRVASKASISDSWRIVMPTSSRPWR